MECSSNRWESFQEDALENILYRLPISSILSARAVCKSWKAKLDRFDFRKLYDLNCTKENEWLIVGGTAVSVYNMSLDRWFQVPITGRWEVCHGAGGLLLLVDSQVVFAVWNPLSNDLKELPPLPPGALVGACVGGKAIVKAAADTKSYKVVVLAYDYFNLKPVVYDSEVGHWCVKKARYVGSTSFNNTSVSNGVIYVASNAGRSVVKYNVEMDESTRVNVAHVESGWDRGYQLRVVPWKGNIYMFARLIDMQQGCFKVSFVRQLGVWVLHMDEWVLLSKAPRHLVKRFGVYNFVVWLDGDIVKLFASGNSWVLTYNLAVADSWNIIKAGRPFPLLLCPSVCMPLTFTAVP